MLVPCPLRSPFPLPDPPSPSIGRGPGLRALLLRLALVLLFPVTCALYPLARSASAIPGCNSPFTTAGEFTCVVPANATSVTITAIGGAGGNGANPGASGGESDSVQAAFALPLGGV